MKKIIFYITNIIIFSIFSINLSYADDNIEKIYKIESYSHDEIIDSYVLEQYGSSIYVKNGLIYTNAHVILNDENKPFGNYRVCKTYDFKENAKCFSTGKLLYYDDVNDLAVLKIEKPDNSGVNFSKKELNIGDVVKVYGYPSNGGDTITYTEGKISGYEKGLYKIDANFDAGNSGGGIFDSDGNLIGMAVSVGLGYTTLGYVIPLEKIEDFIVAKGENIEIYNKEIDKDFSTFTFLRNNIVGANKFENKNIKFNNFLLSNFKITDFLFDNTKENFYLELADKNDETGISITNLSIEGKDKYNLDDYYNFNKKESEKLKDETYVKLVNIKKVKIKGKDTILSLILTKENEVYLNLLIEQSKNNYIEVSIVSSNLKNKSFLRGVKLILKNLDILEYNSTKNNDFLHFDNLISEKIDGFYVSKNINGDKLINYGDINVSKNYYSKYKLEDFGKDYNLSEGIKSTYYTMKDYYYLNNFSIKETKNGEKYVYTYGINNKTKSGIENKDEDKYFINAYFYEKIDNENLYYSVLTFTFNKEESKKEIDKLLNSIKTNSGKDAFPIGELKIGENIVGTEE